LNYVRVDDEWAHYLFTDTLDGNSLNKWRFHERMKAEIDSLKNNDALGYFYYDEAYYNNIPCIAEVNRLVRKYSQNTTELIPLACLPSFGELGGQKNRLTGEEVANYLYNTGAVKDIFMSDYFPYLYWIKLPANVTHPNVDSFPGTRDYKYAHTNEEYDDTLNNLNFDILGLTYINIVRIFVRNIILLSLLISS